MKKAAFPVMLILLLLAGLVVATGAAGDEPVEVEIPVWKHGMEYHIGPGEVGVLQYGWGACSPGLVRMFIGAINFEVTLGDTVHLTPEEVDGLWGAIEIYDPRPEWEACVGVARPAESEWRYSLPTLAPGRYELRTWWWLDHPIIDGADYDGDGRPDRSTPEDWDNDTLNIIYYEE